MVAEICRVGETVLVLVADVPATAAVDSAIIPSARIVKNFFIFMLLLVLESPAGQFISIAFGPAYLFILKWFLIWNNGTSVIRTLLCAVLRAFFENLGFGGILMTILTHDSEINKRGFTLGTTLINRRNHPRAARLEGPVRRHHPQTSATAVASKVIRNSRCRRKETRHEKDRKLVVRRLDVYRDVRHWSGSESGRKPR